MSDSPDSSPNKEKTDDNLHEVPLSDADIDNVHESIDDILDSVRDILTKPSPSGETSLPPDTTDTTDENIDEDDVLQLTKVVNSPDVSDTTESLSAEQALLSQQASEVGQKAFMRLQESLNTPSPTLNELALEALRPLLREWLDKNLPRLVNDLVEKEIHRMTQFNQTQNSGDSENS